MIAGGCVPGLVASATASIRAVMLPDRGHSRVPAAAPEASVTGCSGAVAPNTPALTRWTAAAVSAVSAGMVVLAQAWYSPGPRRGARPASSCGATSEPGRNTLVTVLARCAESGGGTDGGTSSGVMSPSQAGQRAIAGPVASGPAGARAGAAGAPVPGPAGGGSGSRVSVVTPAVASALTACTDIGTRALPGSGWPARRRTPSGSPG